MWLPCPGSDASRCRRAQIFTPPPGRSYRSPRTTRSSPRPTPALAPSLPDPVTSLKLALRTPVRVESSIVTIKDRLHKLIDELSEPEADDALRYIAQRRVDPVVAAFRDAPVDDEPVTAEDEGALAEVDADRAAGVPRISYAEMKRKHGYP